MNAHQADDFKVGELTDGELTRGIAHYKAALAAHAPDAPIRADIADLLAQYEDEIAERRATRAADRAAAVKRAAELGGI